jgi:hypothetical protein
MKIDVGRIVIAHLKTLRDAGRSRINLFDLLLFYGFPIVLGVLCVWLKWKLSADVLNSLLTAYSIFAGLLLNLLLLVYTFSTQTVHPSALAKARTALVQELHDNIAYSILISIILVVMCMAGTAYLKMFDPPLFTNRWVTAAIAFFTFNFVLTLLMILKRIYVLLNAELGKKNMVADFPKKSASAR